MDYEVFIKQQDGQLKSAGFIENAEVICKNMGYQVLIHLDGNNKFNLFLSKFYIVLKTIERTDTGFVQKTI